MKNHVHDLAQIIDRIESSPARGRLDLNFIKAILCYTAHLSDDEALADPKRFRRYVILLHELGLLNVKPAGPRACRCYPCEVEVTGITPEGLDYLEHLINRTRDDPREILIA